MAASLPARPRREVVAGSRASRSAEGNGRTIQQTRRWQRHDRFTRVQARKHFGVLVNLGTHLDETQPRDAFLHHEDGCDLPVPPNGGCRHPQQAARSTGEEHPRKRSGACSRGER